MMNRRRALMGKGDSDSTIYGSKLTWSVGNIDSTTGEINPSYPTYISSGFVNVEGGKVLTYTGPDKDENDIAFYVYVGQYDENHDFISRTALYAVSGHIVTVQLVENCKYIRFQFGHITSTSVNMNVSDGSLLVCAVQDRSEVKNGFVDGSYSKGTTSFSIANNVFSFSYFGNAIANTIEPKFKFPLSIKSGDTLRVLIKKTNGTLSGGFYAYISISGQEIITNQLWNTGATAMDKSGTAPSNGNTTSFYCRNATAAKSCTDYKCTIQIFKNGVQVIPEV